MLSKAIADAPVKPDQLLAFRYNEHHGIWFSRYQPVDGVMVVDIVVSKLDQLDRFVHLDSLALCWMTSELF